MKQDDGKTVYGVSSGEFRPLSYREWKSEFEAGGRIASYDEYKSYVRGWTDTKAKEADSVDAIRSDYIDMLRSIYVYLGEKERKAFFDDIDWDSQLDLAAVIPVFAKKIRDIIRYFADARETVLRSKLKYNMHGTFLSIERMLHEYLLSNYTRRRWYESGEEIGKGEAIPELSSVNGKLHTRIREYYDGENYYDKDPRIPVSAYFAGACVPPSGIEFERAGVLYDGWDLTNRDEADWLFGGGYADGRMVDNPMLDSVRSAVLNTSGLSGEELESAFDDYVIGLTRKYLGNNLVFISGGNYHVPKVNVRCDFYAGENWFYFPSGAFQGNVPVYEIPPVSIHDTNLDKLGTGGDSYDTADRIFVRTGNGLKGAWLKHEKYLGGEWIDGIIPGGSPLQFRFPFLGYGVSAEGLEWTGPSLTNRNPDYDSMTEDEKLAVRNRYWNNERPDFQCDTLYVQDLGLNITGSGATPASQFDRADHLSVRSDFDAGGSVYSDAISQMWLFSSTVTEIPVGTKGRSQFYFPNEYLSVAPFDGLLPRNSWCKEVPLVKALSGGAGVGCVGGSCPSESDVIYKLDSQGNEIEAAWLSARSVPRVALRFSSNGSVVTTTGVDGLYEANGLVFTVNPGEDYRFVWTGGDRDMANVFFDTGDERFSPAPSGTDGKDFDYIYQDEMFPDDTSPDDALMIGFVFEGGEWKEANGRKSLYGPKMKNNVIYRYHRSSDAVPLKVIHSYARVSNYPVWKSMTRDSEGNWVGNATNSPMVLRSGDRFAYAHIGSRDVRIVEPITVGNETVYRCGTFEERHGSFALRINLVDPLPYWADATNEDVVDFAKPVDVYNMGIRVEDGIPLQNPRPTTKQVRPWDVVTYLPKKKVTWKRDVGYGAANDEVHWKALSAIYVDNPFGQMLNLAAANRVKVISAVPTDVDSDIEFSYVPGDVVLVNYVAQKGFSWEEEYSTISTEANSVSGAVVAPETSLVVSEAQYPHANLANRHYPSFAVAVNPSELFTVEDVGGYFVPDRLGVSVAVSKDTVVETDPGLAESSGFLYSEGHEFAEDQGFTHTEQNIGRRVVSEDDTWSRVGVFYTANAGMRNGNDRIQSFIPYQTEEESRGRESRGVSHEFDSGSPWLHYDGDRWDPYFSLQGFTPNKTKQEPSRRWANTRFERSDIGRLRSDMNGIQYAIAKPRMGSRHTIYDRRDEVGVLVYRAYDEFVRGICDLNSDLYDINALKYGWVVDIDCAIDHVFARCRIPDGSGLVKIQVPSVTGNVWKWYADVVRERFRARFEALADFYGVSEFLDVVPSGEIRNKSDMVDDIRRLADGIRKHYIGVSLARESFVAETDRSCLNGDEISSFLSTYDVTEETESATIHTYFYNLAGDLNDSLPFPAGMEYLVVLRVIAESGDDGMYKASVRHGNIWAETVVDGEISPGWYMNKEKRYVYPVLRRSGGRTVPSFYLFDLAGDVGFSERRCLAFERNKVDNVEAGLSSIASLNPWSSVVRYRPVCMYNEDTATLTVVRQISGENSEVGAFSVYAYDMLNDQIGGYYIAPENTEDKFKEYENSCSSEVASSVPWNDDRTSAEVYTVTLHYNDWNGNSATTGIEVLSGTYFEPDNDAYMTKTQYVKSWKGLPATIMGNTTGTASYDNRIFSVVFNSMDGSKPNVVLKTYNDKVYLSECPVVVGRTGTWRSLANNAEITSAGVTVLSDMVVAFV